MNLISIVIPVGEGFDKRLLIQSIKSVLNQNYKKTEFIFIAQNKKIYSSVFRIIKKIGKVKNVKIFVQTGKGIGNARKEGVNKSRGDFICMLDADDEMLQNKIKYQLKTFRDTRADVIFSNAYKNVIDENQKYVSRKKQKTRFITIKDLNYINVLYASTVMFRTETVKKINYGEQNYSEDYNLWLRLLLNNKKIFYLNKNLVIINYDKGLFKRRSKFGNAIAEMENFKLKNKINNYNIKNVISLFIHTLYFLIPPLMKYLIFKIQHKKLIKVKN